MEKDGTSPKATRRPASRAGTESTKGRKNAATGTVARTRAAKTGTSGKSGASDRTGAAAPRKGAARPAKATVATLTSAERLEMIREAAYYHAERRGFTPGSEAADWLAAETEIDARLAAVAPRPSGRSAGKRAN